MIAKFPPVSSEPHVCEFANTAYLPERRVTMYSPALFCMGCVRLGRAEGGLEAEVAVRGAEPPMTVSDLSYTVIGGSAPPKPSWGMHSS